MTHLFVFDPSTVFTKGEGRLAAMKSASVEQQHLDATYGFAGLALLVVGFLLQAVAVAIQIFDPNSQGSSGSPPR